MRRIRPLSGVLQITIQRRYINLAVVPIPFTANCGDFFNGQLNSRAISLSDILASEQHESRTRSFGAPYGCCVRDLCELCVALMWTANCAKRKRQKKKKESENALLSHSICNALCLNYISHSDKAVWQPELQKNGLKGLRAKNKEQLKLSVSVSSTLAPRPFPVSETVVSVLCVLSFTHVFWGLLVTQRCYCF